MYEWELPGPQAAHAVDELDTTLAEHEERLITMNEIYQTLGERTRELVEARHVLRETAVFFEQVCSRRTQILSHLLLFVGTKFTHHLTIPSHPFFKRTERPVTFLATFNLTLSSSFLSLSIFFDAIAGLLLPAGTIECSHMP